MPSSSSSGGGAIYRNNEAGLEMSIADLSHAEDVPFNIGYSDRSIKLITLARMVGPDYCLPNINMIGDEMLNLNWKSY